MNGTGAKALLSAFALALTLGGMSGCGAPQPMEETQTETQEAVGAVLGDVAEDTNEADAEAAAELQEAYDKALSGEGIVSTFIGEPFYDGEVKDEEDALKAIQSVMDRIGGDDSTVLECFAEQPTETGTTYYSFIQQAGDVKVHGASVKLITDKDNKAIGLVSSIMPNIKIESLESWATTQEEAEEVVRRQLADDGVKGVDVIPDASHQTLLALESGSDLQQYAWVVYTQNYYEDVDMGYLAHYVSEDGAYLYNIPVLEPWDVESYNGESTYLSFDFDQYEQAEWTGDAILHDGTTKQLTLPVLRNPDTGETVLGDAERKVLCGDYASFDSDGEVVPVSSNDASFESIDLLVYDTYLRVWDFYKSIGWTGPDDLGSPSLLLMNYLNENGQQEKNAVYTGRYGGWQTFAFTRLASYGECIDVIGHEFTHCVTGTTMTTNLYKNDMGAINEGMSDVMGNLVEMLIGNNPDGAWTIGEGGGEDTLIRSMSDPHTHGQPEYAWDVYYAPSVAVGNDNNDQGGVHTNSSLLNRVSYKLGEAGMTPEDQVYFWMNVALAMTPNTDYPQMAELMPWCMAQAGCQQYVDAVKKAIDEAKFTVTEPPAELPEGAGAITVECPDVEISDAGGFILFLFPQEGAADTSAWPPVGSTLTRAVVQPGAYTAFLVIENSDGMNLFTYTAEGWAEAEGINDRENSAIINVGAGESVQLDLKGVLDKE
ncbi:MAG: M4 family metallopeptidase [Atopobiaceae bacterium]|nr:M4 family metallopeptidase [Atopobiaceae bacterium]